ncbi:hypothetical protein EV191_101108 [Tamaricihabitans halophyticus]|uniref:Uncharacterized protein n=1 Tax=Tamaricihabitans halophyticus TaxID=1262583 RepID=A0A4R2R3H6_9PSEU|nr:hypothetical protein [Tamaricihabitans halophyticus]TCP56168.1 hypothetical protein EV191_101108 [Tamaricihabitans halophyticus]
MWANQAGQYEEVRRPDDGELVGYVAPVDSPPGDSSLGGSSLGASSQCWQSMAVFGYPLGEPAGYTEAVDRLLRTGLEYLAEPWQVYLAADDRWYNCLLQEVSPSRVRLSISDYGSADFGAELTLHRPGADQLRPTRAW